MASKFFSDFLQQDSPTQCLSNLKLILVGPGWEIGQMAVCNSAKIRKFPWFCPPDGLIANFGSPLLRIFLIKLDEIFYNSSIDTGLS